MPIPAGVGRIVLVGTLRGGEIFNTGWWGQGDLFSTDAGCQTQADSVVASLGTSEFSGLWTNIADTATIINKVMVYGYPEGGPHASVMAESPTHKVGGGPAALPLQCCLVATTLTGSPGRSNRGRIYWPVTGANVGTDNQLSEAITQQVATVTYALLAPGEGSGPGPIVVSQKHGTFKPITSIRVDSRVDIQRRRAAKEAATYIKTVSS